MPGLPVIPEVDCLMYDCYARQVAKRRRTGQGNAWNTTSENRCNRKRVPKRGPKTDYYGLDNSMKKLTLTKSRKWRTTNNDDSPRVAWQTTRQDKNGDKSKENGKDEEDDDKQSVVSVDRNSLRKNRSSRFTKFKYPEKFHYGLRSEHSQLEENIPQCLRMYPRYCNQPVKQACAYNPIRSVTQLNVHSIKSCGLPHPNPNGTVTKRRRPTSAPPGTMTSYSDSKASLHGRNSYVRTNSVRSGSSVGNKQRPQTAIGRRENDLVCEDLERNGSFQYCYEVEEPTHVTLEVLDSDDEQNDVTEFNSSRDEPSAASSANGNSDDRLRQWRRRDAADAEPDIESDSEETSRDNMSPEPVPEAEEVASEAACTEDYNDFVYSDVESESAKSIDSDY